VNRTRKEFKLQTLLIETKEGNIISNKERVMRSSSECYEGLFELQERTDSNIGEEQTMCIQTAESHIEPPNGVDTEIAISKLICRNATGRDQNPAELIKKKEKSSRRSNGKRSHDMSGNVALCV
jgi:hypothetical protein